MEAVAAVMLFKVDAGKAARMAPRLYCAAAATASIQTDLAFVGGVDVQTKDFTCVL